LATVKAMTASVTGIR